MTSLAELTTILKGLRSKKKTVAHCHGVFDLLHPGHIRHLEEAKREADILVVTVTPDRFVNKGPGRPAFPDVLRAEALAALAVVDYVAINEFPTAVEAITALRPDVYVKGMEYKNAEEDVTGKIRDEEAAVKTAGGRMHFTDDITFSSSALLNAHVDVLPSSVREKLRDIRERFGAKDIIARLEGLRGLKVLVIGDAIIDEYCFCRALGAGSKSAAINARFLESESHAGGILAVANHVAGFCDRVDMVTNLGTKDSREDFIRSKLRPNVSPTFLMRTDGPTTIKRRFLTPFRYQRMFELTYVEDRPLPSPLLKELHAYIEKHASKYDLVLVADFGHGLLSAETAKLLSTKARFLALNVQTNSTNQGFSRITKYPKAHYLCIDQEEIRLTAQDRFGPLDAIIKNTAKELHCDAVTVTMGSEGSATYRPAASAMATMPVFSHDVLDSVGAGDAFLSLAALCAAKQFAPELIGFIGNAVGAMAIRVLGNRESIEPVPLFKYIDRLLK